MLMLQMQLICRRSSKFETLDICIVQEEEEEIRDCVFSWPLTQTFQRL